MKNKKNVTALGFKREIVATIPVKKELKIRAGVTEKQKRDLAEALRTARLAPLSIMDESDTHPQEQEQADE